MNTNRTIWREFKILALPSMLTIVLYICYFVYTFFTSVFMHATRFEFIDASNTKDTLFYAGILISLIFALAYAAAMMPVSIIFTKVRSYMEAAKVS
jgi:polyferredoxin